MYLHDASNSGWEKGRYGSFLFFNWHIRNHLIFKHRAEKLFSNKVQDYDAHMVSGTRTHHIISSMEANNNKDLNL